MNKSKKHSSPIGWALAQTGEHKKQYVFSVIFAIIGVAFSIAPYFIVIRIVHGFMTENRNLSFYLKALFLMAIFWILRVVFHALSTSLSHKATFTVLSEIRKKCLEKLAKIPLGIVLYESSGALKNTLIERIDSIETTLAHIVPEFTANLLVPLFIMVYIFILDWRMGLAAILTMPIGLFCYAYMMKKSDKFYQHTIDATKALNDMAVEYIGGIQVIKVFGKTKSSYERFVHSANEEANSYIDWMKKSIVPFTSGMVIMPATLIFVLPIGSFLVKHQTLSAQNFITILILSVGLITPLITLMSYSDDFMKMSTIFGEVQKILNTPNMKRPSKKEITKDNFIKDNTIKLDNVYFSYNEKEVLHGISLTVPEGSFVSLVGPSGSGKSTIARLIASLWDVNKGKITLGNIDIRDIPLQDYVDKVAFVSQDNFLFNMTVRENIRLGRPSASDEEVYEVAKKSGCHDFILNLENGYDTKVGAFGNHLSGGEKQRITIARAMLKNAPIVILDEATAYMDPENEALIQKSISELTKGKTLIVIAHRLSTITSSDCIYVVNNGFIIDHGTHNTLLSHHGLYEKMWNNHMEVKYYD